MKEVEKIEQMVDNLGLPSKAHKQKMKKILGILFTLVLVSVMVTPLILGAGTSTFTDLTTTLTPNDLAADLVGAGVTIVPGSVNYTGAPQAAGTFLFTGDHNVTGISSGIILSSGNISDVKGPNNSPSTTTDFGRPGDTDLDALSGFTTYDAAVLKFNFTVDPGVKKVYFRYVFGSEEYNEYVYSAYNDVFAFFVNGINYAKVGAYPVSINTINSGNILYPSNLSKNPQLYINNDPFNANITGQTIPSGSLLYTQMDGFTKVLVFQANVTSGAVNTMKLTIADTSDGILDSWVFIEAGSLTTTPLNKPPVFGTPSPANSSTNNPLSFTWNIPINDPEGNNYTWSIQCNNGQGSGGGNAGTTFNGTRSLSLTGLAYSTTYKIWVNATDPTGSNLFTRRWYTFTTVGAPPSNQPPVFGTPTPANGSTGNSLGFTWSIPINDPEGNVFNWTIQCSNGQTSNASGAVNGTKSLTLTGLTYLTPYTIWVNATDPTGSGYYTRAWYTFVTGQKCNHNGHGHDHDNDQECNHNGHGHDHDNDQKCNHNGEGYNHHNDQE